MPLLTKDRVIVEDRWALLREAASLADVPANVPVIVPLPEARVILGAVVVMAATTVTAADAEAKPVSEAVIVVAPAGRLLNV